MPTRKRPVPPSAIADSCGRCPTRANGSFKDLAPSALACLDRRRKVNRYLRGQIVYGEGNTALAAYCVQSGTIKLYHMDADGRQHVLGVAGPGTLLGAGSVLSGLPCTETAEAVEPSVVCLLDEAGLRSTLRENPPLWESLVRGLTKQLAQAQTSLLARAHLPARAKMAGLLLSLGGGRDGKEDLPYTRQDLADMIGVSQETAIRTLSDFRRRKAISLSGRRLSVLRADLLQEWSEKG